MGGFFTLLQDRVDRNAQRAVEVYTDELPDFRVMATRTPVRSAMLAEDLAPFTPEDLAVLSAFGAERGRQGVSLTSQRRVMVLHSTLTLREIQEAAGPNDVEYLMRMLEWLPANGLAAQGAYTRGYLLGQRSYLPLVSRVRQLASALLADDVVAADVAESLGMRVSDDYLVLSVRVVGPPPDEDERDQLVHALLQHTRAPMTWGKADEFVALLPDGSGEQTEQRALTLAGQVAEMVELPCSTGVAVGKVGALADAAALAGRVCQVSPPQATPSRLSTVQDMFAELGVMELPQVDEWLTGLGRRLSTGPDLVRTLDVFYRHDMNRLNTAAELRVHPRTLDYRLHRVRELVGIEPSSTRGVRTLSTAVARLRAR
jgi:hypothetical protein